MQSEEIGRCCGIQSSHWLVDYVRWCPPFHHGDASHSFSFQIFGSASCSGSLKYGSHCLAADARVGPR